jgi:hypothetical protein
MEYIYSPYSQEQLLPNYNNIVKGMPFIKSTSTMWALWKLFKSNLHDLYSVFCLHCHFFATLMLPFYVEDHSAKFHHLYSGSILASKFYKQTKKIFLIMIFLLEGIFTGVYFLKSII